MVGHEYFEVLMGGLPLVLTGVAYPGLEGVSYPGVVESREHDGFVQEGCPSQVS